MSGVRVFCKWANNRRNSWILSATIMTVSITRQRIDSFCSLCQMCGCFALPSTERASTPERQVPAWRVSCDGANRANYALHNDQARSLPWQIGSIPRSSSAVRQQQQVLSIRSCQARRSRKTPCPPDRRSSGGPTVNDPIAVTAAGTDEGGPVREPWPL